MNRTRRRLTVLLFSAAVLAAAAPAPAAPPANADTAAVVTVALGVATRQGSIPRGHTRVGGDRPVRVADPQAPHPAVAVPALIRREGRQLVVAVHPPLPDPESNATRDLEACREALSPIVRDYVRRFPEQCPFPALGSSTP